MKACDVKWYYADMRYKLVELDEWTESETAYRFKLSRIQLINRVEILPDKIFKSEIKEEE